MHMIGGHLWWQVRKIKAVEQQGRRVILTEALRWPHYGGSEYQAEVGLLSRSITLSSPAASEEKQRGGHVHVDGGQARLRGVLAFRLGQRNTLGTYPFHFHRLGPAYDSYMQDCAVWRSFYRCFVIHGTSQTTLSDNVAFDAAGSCFYLEDGVEEDNILDHNLAAFVHVIGAPAAGGGQEGSTHHESPGLAQPADAAAAGFYLTNAWNIVTRNAASGGWTGFSLPRLVSPVGSHRWVADSKDMSPASRPTKRFAGNSAHSSGYMWQRGACFYAGGDLRHDSTGKLVYSSGREERDTRFPDKDGGAEAWMEFTDTKV